ncbi:ribosome maturation factor RimM [Simiduia agarivorans]|uniref:Ribosome maturation factor RimM n=1 Tax=Simiduia agarivorans (strain DSM 21679 / JCM 13881 / BCRC 17597 / SA1) TaxID=1117647 RepID=K4KI69_SIMAS|nr:ribosome maturation factor RimM [Simiduia agarivorans]AFU97905.1 16S rRNA-processing protein RimM [Simiduia agarivorans SA1 = DSM 21679]
MVDKQSNLIDVGRVTSVFGIKGWVKVHSDTEPPENIAGYSPWWLKTRHGVKAMEVEEFQPHGKGFIARFKGVDDRDGAEALARVTIAIERSQLPPLAPEEYYWHQLEGLKVINEYEGEPQVLGCVKHLLETGANDVLVVAPTEDSLDDRERLVPYVPGQFVKQVDLVEGLIRVEWDPDF